MAQEENFNLTIAVVLGVTFLIIAAVIGFLLVQNVSSIYEEVETSGTLSETYTPVTSLTNTITPTGEGITSSEVKAYNQTWLNFDGVNDKVVFNNPNITYPWNNDNITTYSIWFKANNWTTGDGTNGRRYIFTNGNSTTHIRLLLGNISSNVLEFDTIHAGGTSSLVLDTSLDNRNDWHNAIISFRGDGYVYGFLDGVYINRQVTTNYNNPLTGSSFELAHLITTGSYYNGSINDFKVINQTIVYSAQAIGIYQDNLKGQSKIFVPTMMRHGINQSGYQSEAIFRTELDWLNASGFQTITDVEFYNWTQDGGFIMPEKPIIYIFDDGLQSVLNTTAPLMAIYGYKAVMAIPTINGNDTSLLDGTEIMNWSEINEVINTYNWSIASHSHNHCGYVSAVGTGTKYLQLTCNTSETAQGNMSKSKQEIIDNTGITPITFIYPFNDWNSTTMEYCRNNYTICYGSSYSYETGHYATKTSNLTNGEISRLNAEDYSNTNNFSHAFNYTALDYDLGNYNLNENNGTTAYDSSGNSNNGTISGATWNNDGILNTLTAITDYTINPTTGLFTIVNSDYLYSWLSLTYTYSGYSTGPVNNLRGNFTQGIDNVSSKIPMLFSVLMIVVILGILGLFYIIYKKMSSVGGGI